MNKQFKSSDDFVAIIKRGLLIDSEPIDIIRSKHGKSSFVFYATQDDKTYLFKFPRTLFQSNYLIHEERITKELKSKFPYRIPEIEIRQDGGRLYAFYELIDGSNMSDVALNNAETETVCLELANILSIFSSINYKNLNVPIKSKVEVVRDFCTDFSYTPDFDTIQDIIDNDIQLIHGDFHRSNILLNSEKKVCGLLDFATVSLGSLYFDLGHMCFSMNEKFNKYFLMACENKLKVHIDRKKIKRMCAFFDDMINKHYVPFIKGE
jgi:serine/threonine protein kinase